MFNLNPSDRHYCKVRGKPRQRITHRKGAVVIKEKKAYKVQAKAYTATAAEEDGKKYCCDLLLQSSNKSSNWPEELDSVISLILNTVNSARPRWTFPMPHILCDQICCWRLPPIILWLGATTQSLSGVPIVKRWVPKTKDGEESTGRRDISSSWGEMSKNRKKGKRVHRQTQEEKLYSRETDRGKWKGEHSRKNESQGGGNQKRDGEGRHKDREDE